MVMESPRAKRAAAEEEAFDGCDVEILESDATPDDALPPAVGGVEIAGTGDDIDGCDVHVDDLDGTPDDQLPAAEGGVA